MDFVNEKMSLHHSLVYYLSMKLIQSIISEQMSLE